MVVDSTRKGARIIQASDLLESVDIVSYISQYIELEQRGREFWGLSCFNEEKTPSFSVDPEKRFWYDFSSHQGGNLLEFIMRHDHTDLRGALSILSKYAGVSEDDPGPSVVRLDATRVAKKYRNHVKPLRQMQAKVLPPDCMERWYEFNREKLQLWVNEGISWETLRLYQVRYDALDDRIVYPVRDYQGNIISICGRTCDPDFKAKKIRKYTYKQTVGTLDTLYAFSDHEQNILDRREIILFEGAKSCMKAHEWGYDNTAALCTSHLSTNQLRFLIRLCSWNPVRVVFALDSDIDITLDDNIHRLTSYARVEWLRNRDDILPPKDSPTDQGREVFERLYARRESLGKEGFQAHREGTASRGGKPQSRAVHREEGFRR